MIIIIFILAKTEMTTTPVDCFVLVLLSHGTEDGIYARDSIMQFADIIEIFNATNCPQLRFKPKVLIIQVRIMHSVKYLMCYLDTYTIHCIS